MAAVGNERERGKEVLGCDSRPHLGLGRRAEAVRREWAAAALVARGGGADAREDGWRWRGWLWGGGAALGALLKADKVVEWVGVGGRLARSAGGH